MLFRESEIEVGTLELARECRHQGDNGQEAPLDEYSPNYFNQISKLRASSKLWALPWGQCDTMQWELTAILNKMNKEMWQFWFKVGYLFEGRGSEKKKSLNQLINLQLWKKIEHSIRQTLLSTVPFLSFLLSFHMKCFHIYYWLHLI